MRLNPVEIRRHRFHTRFRGFDPGEVEAFLEAVVSDFEAVVRENAHLRREAEQLAREVEHLRGRELAIQETLMTAQQVVEQLKHTAIKESEVLVSEAQIQAEKLLREAEARRSDLQREIIELSQIRDRAEMEARKGLEGYLSMIDAFRQARLSREGQSGSEHGGRAKRHPLVQADLSRETEPTSQERRVEAPLTAPRTLTAPTSRFG
jgi:cell division initiation protein